MSKGSDNSETSSQIGLESININRLRPLPEEWTLPSEWNIEQRELYANWKLDLQSQIKNIDQQLVASFKEHPREEDGSYFDLHQPRDTDVIKHLRMEVNAGKMQKGLKRD